MTYDPDDSALHAIAPKPPGRRLMLQAMLRSQLLGLALLFVSTATFAATVTGPAAPSVVAQATAALCGKRVALLGELPSHGEGTAFLLKADIVQALVRQCGFDTVVFEAPVYDFMGLDQQWGKGFATRQRLDDAIGPFWWAHELARFRAWLFDEANAGRVHLLGMDDQISITSAHARAVLPKMVAARFSGAQARACLDAVDRQLNWSYDEQHPRDEAEQGRLLQCAQGAASAERRSAEQDAEEPVLLLNFSNYVARQAGQADAVARNEQMFRNANRSLGNRKLVIWTATVHAAKRQGGLGEKPLGAWFHDRLGDRVGSIGFTALGGKSSMAGKPARELVPAPSDSLEARLLAPGLTNAYAGSAALARLGVIKSRLLGKFTAADWSSQFDGVVVVREEVPPDFELLH